jgi:hypothetical protein
MQEDEDEAIYIIQDGKVRLTMRVRNRLASMSWPELCLFAATV